MPPVPGVWPRDEPRPTDSHAERAVWRALRSGLPPGWMAWHSLRLRSGRATHGEGDFVLAHPERGILLLEVKGGAIEVRGGQWLQNGRPMKAPPLDQAHQFRNLLLRRFRERNITAPSIGQAPCFPDSEFDRQPTADDVAGIVVGPTELRWLAQSLPKIVERAVPPPRVTDRAWVEALHAMWCETWVPTLSLGGRAREQESLRLSLDETQLEVLEGLLENDRVLVQGGAGSGKTLLAAEAARRLAADGRPVLLLCFTVPLRRWLEERLAGTGVEVQTVSGLAKRLEDQVGPAPENPRLDGADGWGVLFRHVAPHATARWDAVVVDEAQDLQPEAWLLVEQVSRDRRLWAFHDPGQQFWADRQPRRDLFGTHYRLPRQQRSPPGILALAHRVLGLPHDATAIAAARTEGTIAKVVCSEGDASATVGAEIDRLLVSGLRPDEIGVVSLRGKAARGQDELRFGRHEAVRADADDAAQRLAADSFLRWKGLERPAMIVTDLPNDALANLPVRLNIALTRATVAVSIVGEQGALDRLGF